MSNDNSNDGAGTVGRRRFITLAGVGGVGSMTLALPGEWTKPIIDLVLVPAYAQSAPTGKVYLADVFRKSTGVVDDGNDANDDDEDDETSDTNGTTGAPTTPTTPTTTPSTTPTTTPTTTPSTTLTTTPSTTPPD